MDNVEGRRWKNVDILVDIWIMLKKRLKCWYSGCDIRRMLKERLKNVVILTVYSGCGII